MLLALTSCASDSIYEDAGGRYRSSESIYLERGNGHYKVGNPYKIMGKKYYPEEDYNYEETGIASWYGADFHAKDTANGEEYNMHTMTAAHRTLPLPSIVEVTNLENGKTAIFRVNDRGPFAKNRIIDISKKGAEVLGFSNQGTTKVKVKILPEESKALKQALLTGKEVNLRVVKNKTNNNSIIYSSSINDDNYLQPISSLSNKKDLSPKVGNYYVQVGAFNQKTGAENLQNQLSSFNEVKIYPATIGNGHFYRVRLGPYGSRQQADDVLIQVKNSGIPNAQTIQD